MAGLCPAQRTCSDGADGGTRGIRRLLEEAAKGLQVLTF